MEQTISRKTLVYGIALVVVLIAVIYGVTRSSNPYPGLTLTVEADITDEERSYVENRIVVTENALAIQREDEDVDLDLLLSLAWDYTIVGNLVDAREIYEEYFDYNAINYTVWANYGIILKRMGDIDGAEDAFLTALQLNPTEANYRNYVTLLEDYFDAGEREDDMFAALQDGVTRVGQTSWFMIKLAEVYVNRGDCETAFEHYEIAIDLEPEITAIVDDYEQLKETCTTGDEA